MEITGIHPYANKFPMLGDDELDALAESIATIGLIHPVVVDPTGLVLDGRNRIEACNRAEVELRLEVYDPDDVAEYVIGCNSDRRHMSTGARAMATALILVADGRREAGRWLHKSLVQSSGSATLRTWQARMKECGLVIDCINDGLLKPDVATQVVEGKLPLDQALKQAQKARKDEEARKAGEAAKIKTETQARAFIEANAPDLAAMVGDTLETYVEAKFLWEQRNAEEAARLDVEAGDETVVEVGGQPFGPQVLDGSIATWADAKRKLEKWQIEFEQSIGRDIDRIKMVNDGWSAMRNVLIKPDSLTTRLIVEGLGDIDRRRINEMRDQIVLDFDDIKNRKDA